MASAICRGSARARRLSPARKSLETGKVGDVGDSNTEKCESRHQRPLFFILSDRSAGTADSQNTRVWDSKSRSASATNAGLN
jgi:hypothetical protein